MAKIRSDKSPADPWVVGLAQMENFVVVCDESEKRRNRKVPGACAGYSVVCITLGELIAAESTIFDSRATQD